MPDYASGFGLAGGLAGGAGGAGAGGLLGQLLGPMDMPRRALWGMPGRLAQGDVLGALPGLAGLAAGGATALVPGGLPFAGMVGSAVGGLGEGLEEALRPNMQQAPEPSDLVRQLGGDPESLGGKAAGMALGMAGDPLSYAGGLGGAAKGSEAGAGLGRFLEGAAEARGPMYPGGEEKLLNLLGQTGNMEPGAASYFKSHINRILEAPNLENVLNEIQPGSTALATGMEGPVLKRPGGPDTGVTRIAGAPGSLRVAVPEGRSIQAPGIGWGAPPPQPNLVDPMIMPSARDAAVGTLRVQQNPFAQFGKFDDLGRPLDPLGALVNEAADPLRANVEGRLPDAVVRDMHGGNLGQTAAGNIAITDAGNVALPGGVPEPVPQSGRFPNWSGPALNFQQGQRDPVTNTLLNLLGSNKSVQDEIAEKLAQGGGAAGMSPDEIRAFQQQAQQAQYNALPPTVRGGGAAPVAAPDEAWLQQRAAEAMRAGPPGADVSEAMRRLGLRLGLRPESPEGGAGSQLMDALGMGQNPRLTPPAAQFPAPFTDGPHGLESPDVLPMSPPGTPGSGVGSLLAELGGGGQPGFTPQQFNAEGGLRGVPPPGPDTQLIEHLRAQPPWAVQQMLSQMPPVEAERIMALLRQRGG